MKNSYKKRLYTQALSLSAAVLLAVLAQGNAAADTLNPAEPPQDSSKISTLVEQPTPASTDKAEEPSTTPQAEPLEKSSPSEATDSKSPSLPSTASEEKAAETTQKLDTTTKTEVRAASSQENKVQLADSKVYMSEKASIEETIQ